MWLKCLRCGHTAYSRTKDPDTARRCSVCGSYVVIPEDIYKSIMDNIIPHIADSTPTLDVLTALIEISKEKGIFVQPVQSWELAKCIVREGERVKRDRNILRE